MPTEEEERVYECERCGHAYTGRYGRYVEIPGGAEWRCHDCITGPKRPKEKSS
jgi:hypothetical protein